MKTFNQKVYDIVRKIPKGYVMNYGQVARLAGNPRAARAVGYALHGNPDPDNIPCHRVVFKDGALSAAFAFGGENQQFKLLKKEKVRFTSNRKVDMEKHKWSADGFELSVFGL